MKKKLFPLALALALCFALAVPAFAAGTSGSCGNGVTWSYSNGTLTIQGSGKIADYTPVLLVDPPWYGYCEQIHTVKIGNGVTAIGNNAFSDCENLTSVTIPSSVTAIGDGAFGSCSSLTNVSIPSGVTTIGANAFANCGGLTSVTIPARVTSIGDGAFSNCTSLTSINVTSGNSAYSSVDGVLFNANQTLLHTYPAGKINKSYSIPASVTSIGDDAFYNCASLTSVMIPNSVTSIGKFAFAWCANLTSVTIPNGVIAIEAWTFLRCSSLASVTIPDSITSIGEYAFSSCESLPSVTIPNSVTTIGNSAFYECTSLNSVTIPNSVKSLGNAVFQGCNSLTSATISSSVTSITLGQFSLCSNLTSVTIPDSVTTIGSMAFNRCDNLKDVYYGGSESQWRQIAISFNKNNALTNATIHYNSVMPTTPAKPTPPAIPAFTDVPAWCITEATWAAQEKITNGYGSSDKFAPNVDCTQAQILTFLWRAEDKPEAATAPVTAATSYQEAINWAYEKGMIDDSFNPDAPCTRSQAVSYIWQALGKQEATKAASFSDVDTNAPYAAAVNWAVEKGITNGYGGSATFSPGTVCNRGQIACFLYRAYNN